MNETITITITVSDALCASIMCTALEGGVGYWCAASDIQRRATVENGFNSFEYVSFKAHDTDATGDGDDALPVVVDYDTIRRGIARLLAPGSSRVAVRADIVAAILSDITAAEREEGGGEIDSEAADCIVQAGLFDSIVYG